MKDKMCVYFQSFLPQNCRIDPNPKAFTFYLLYIGNFQSGFGLSIIQAVEPILNVRFDPLCITILHKVRTKAYDTFSATLFSKIAKF